MKRALDYSKKLEQVGLSRDQAEAHLEILGEVMESDFAKKSDLDNLKKDLKHDIDNVDINLRKEIQDVEMRLRIEMKEMENRLTQKMAAMTGTTVAILSAVQVWLN